MAFFKVSKFFLYAALFSVVFVNTETLFPFIVTKYVFFRTTVALALVAFLLGWFFLKGDGLRGFEKDLKARIKSPLVIAVSVFVLAYIFAGFFGFNSHYSFWSNFERGEGGFQLLNLYVFFLLLVLLFKEKKDWFGFFKTAIVAAVLVVGYGLLAALQVPGFVGVPLKIGQRFQGSLGNTAYVGTYLLFTLFYTFYILGGGFKKISRNLSKVLLWLLILAFLFFIWFTQTRGPFLGLAGGLGAVLLFLVFRGSKKVKAASAIVLIVAVLLGGFMYSIRTAPIMQKLALTRFFNITVDNLSTQSRFWSWGSAVEGWQERPIFGWGPENYGRLFDKYFDTRHFLPNQASDTWYDRAHSVFFDYLAETGIVGLLSYFSIFFVFYILFFRKRDELEGSNRVNALLFAMPIAYLIQGLVIFDVLPIYLNLFMFLAFANYKFQEKHD